jgi:hypothetical protein
MATAISFIPLLSPPLESERPELAKLSQRRRCLTTRGRSSPKAKKAKFVMANNRNDPKGEP